MMFNAVPCREEDKEYETGSKVYQYTKLPCFLLFILYYDLDIREDQIERMKKLPISMIALDVDGTLLTDDFTISDRTKRIIQQAQAQNIKIILATGRNPRSCYPIMEELNLVSPMITHNGAVIVDSVTKNVTNVLGFTVQDMQEIIHYCRKHHLHFDLNGAFEMYVESFTPAAKEMYAKFHMTPLKVEDIFNLEEVLVKLTIFAEEKQLNEVYFQLKEICSQWRIIRSGEYFIDIMHPQATKGAALRHILKEEQIHPEELVAFGNYYNDIEMLQMAGLGVAMDNSPVEVKQLADRITTSNNEDGVAVVLEELLKDKL